MALRHELPNINTQRIKRIVAVSLAIGAAGMAAGCSGSNSSPSTTSESVPTATRPEVVLDKEVRSPLFEEFKRRFFDPADSGHRSFELGSQLNEQLFVLYYPHLDGGSTRIDVQAVDRKSLQRGDISFLSASLREPYVVELTRDNPEGVALTTYVALDVEDTQSRVGLRPTVIWDDQTFGSEKTQFSGGLPGSLSETVATYGALLATAAAQQVIATLP